MYVTENAELSVIKNYKRPNKANLARTDPRMRQYELLFSSNLDILAINIDIYINPFPTRRTSHKTVVALRSGFDIATALRCFA